MDQKKNQDGGNSSEREQTDGCIALDNFPGQEQLNFLATELEMRLARVKRWFMNKRIASY